MNNEELNIILSGGENSRTEFKEALYSLPSEVFQTVVSFLNHEGGTILFGVTDLGEIKGIDPLSVDKIDNTDLFLYTQRSGWIENGVKLKYARIKEINHLAFDDFKKGSSLTEKGVMLLDKQTHSVIKLLLICIVPVKVAEMLILLSFGSRDKLREIYLKPLIKEGFIALTIPDKPNSPEQRYVLTEKGKLFLGGFEII